MAESQIAKNEIFQLKVWHHLILCAALFTNEVAITYELIYMVTWEKLLGLPVQYVSLPGVISAVVSFILIPVMGRLGDGGDRFRRKCALVIVSGALMFLGAACLLVGCIIKVIVMDNDKSIGHCTPLWNETDQTEDSTFYTNLTIRNESLANCSMGNLDYNFKQDSISMVTSVLAVLTFVLVDTGFDTGGSNIRGFMLECVHKSQHSKVLSIGVIMSGFGGCVISLLGLFDLDVSSKHSMDPNLVKAMTLSLFLMISVLVTIPTTLIYGHYLLHGATLTSTYATDEHFAAKVHTERVKCSEIIQTECRIKNEKTNYLQVKDVLESSNPEVNESAEQLKDGCLQTFEESSSHIEQLSFPENQSIKNQSDETLSDANSLNFINSGEAGNELSRKSQFSGNLIDCNNSNREFHSKHKFNFMCVEYPRRYLRTGVRFIRNLPSRLKDICKSYKKSSLLLACLLCFFTSGANATFEIYFTNYLAEGVYRGNGDADQQEESKQRYDDGMKTAAIGTFVFQSVFLIYNAAHQKISSESGLVYEFLVVSFMMIPSLLAFIVTESLIAYYITIVLNGAYRTLVFTTPFILAAETIRMTDKGRITDTDQMTSLDAHDGSCGSVIASVGAMLPLNFLLSSCIMGPLLEATGSPVTPMYYVVSAAIAAILVLFSLITIRVRQRRKTLQTLDGHSFKLK